MATACRYTDRRTLYTLTLTEQEAQALRVVLDRVGGHNRLTARKYLEEIAAVLKDLGVTKPTTGEYTVDATSPIPNSIWFGQPKASNYEGLLRSLAKLDPLSQNHPLMHNAA